MEVGEEYTGATVIEPSKGYEDWSQCHTHTVMSPLFIVRIGHSVTHIQSCLHCLLWLLFVSVFKLAAVTSSSSINFFVIMIVWKITKKDFITTRCCIVYGLVYVHEWAVLKMTIDFWICIFLVYARHMLVFALVLICIWIDLLTSLSLKMLMPAQIQCIVQTDGVEILS